MTGRRDLKQQLKKLERIQNIWDNPDYNEAVRKAHKMSAQTIVLWLENNLNDIGKFIDDYRKTGEKQQALELRRIVSILQALTEELLAQSE